MLTTSMVKILALSMFCITLSGGCIGTGILFAGYCLSISSNPEESEALFGIALMGFALIETFVFMSVGMSVFILTL